MENKAISREKRQDAEVNKNKRANKEELDAYTSSRLCGTRKKQVLILEAISVGHGRTGCL